MSIEKRLERLEAIVDARGLDWDHPRVADEPAKKWRILEPGEVVQDGDLMNSKLNPPSDPPNGGWLAATSFCFGKEASFYSGVYYARPVVEEPEKEAGPEHPAGPMPDPGDGYRILSKDEDLRDGDELLHPRLGVWLQSIYARLGYKSQDTDCWYRRKIETPQPPEPECREPVLPADCGKQCEFSDDGSRWFTLDLAGFNNCLNWPWLSRTETWRYARIKKDA